MPSGSPRPVVHGNDTPSPVCLYGNPDFQSTSELLSCWSQAFSSSTLPSFTSACSASFTRWSTKGVTSLWEQRSCILQSKAKLKALQSHDSDTTQFSPYLLMLMNISWVLNYLSEIDKLPESKEGRWATRGWYELDQDARLGLRVVFLTKHNSKNCRTSYAWFCM